MSTGRIHGAKTGLYYELKDYHTKDKDNKKRVYNKPHKKRVVLELSEEELLKILEDDLARTKKEVEPELDLVVEKLDAVEVKEAPAPAQLSEAHDLVFDKTLKKWLHVTVKYDIKDASVKVIGPNQAVAMKTISDFFTNKAIKGRK